MPPFDLQAVVTALQTVLDPEVGVNIVDLGLVYGIQADGRDLRIQMTMTSSACPLGAYLAQSVERAIRGRISEAGSVQVAMVWQPPWDPAMMSVEAKQQLGWRA